MREHNCAQLKDAIYISTVTVLLIISFLTFGNEVS